MAGCNEQRVEHSLDQGQVTVGAEPISGQEVARQADKQAVVMRRRWHRLHGNRLSQPKAGEKNSYCREAISGASAVRRCGANVHRPTSRLLIAPRRDWLVVQD